MYLLDSLTTTDSITKTLPNDVCRGPYVYTLRRIHEEIRVHHVFMSYTCKGNGVYVKVIVEFAIYFYTKEVVAIDLLCNIIMMRQYTAWCTDFIT